MDAQQGATAAEGAGTPPFSPRQLRLLKVAIAVMSAILVIGFAVIAGRIVYLVGHADRRAASPAARTHLPLPAGAAVRGIAMSGERLAVHYEAPEGAGIAILDLATGKSVTHVDLSPQQ